MDDGTSRRAWSPHWSRVREPALTYLANRWETLGQGAGKASISATGGRLRCSTKSTAQVLM